MSTENHQSVIAEAIANADVQLNKANLPTYTETVSIIQSQLELLEYQIASRQQKLDPSYTGDGSECSRTGLGNFGGRYVSVDLDRARDLVTKAKTGQSPTFKVRATRVFHAFVRKFRSICRTTLSIR